MRYDYDLIRSILIHLADVPPGEARPKLTIEGYDRDTIGFHVYLMHKDGLLNAAILNQPLNQRSPSAIPFHLENRGFAFLHAARDETIWARFKARIAETGIVVPIDAARRWLTNEAEKVFSGR